MENISRINVYRELLLDSMNLDLSEKFMSLLKINISILDGIEQLFLEGSRRKSNSSLQIRTMLQDNIERTRRLEISSEVIDVNDLLKSLYIILESEKEEKEKNFFNRVIKKLILFNDRHITNIFDLFENRDRAYEKSELDVKWRINRIKQQLYNAGGTKVFLSYAYEDKLYTGALFFYFLRYGIELYIDWMHNPDISDGKELKALLSNELSQSEQFLFLRTINSELCLRGNYYVRPWCAWEMGNYYEHIKDEKYYISLYGVPKANNMQLDGLKVLKSIYAGRLSEV